MIYIYIYTYIHRYIHTYIYIYYICVLYTSRALQSARRTCASELEPPWATQVYKWKTMADVPKLIASRLLEGWCMLNKSCEKDLTPLLRSRDGRELCVACERDSERSAQSTESSAQVLSAQLPAAMAEPVEPVPPPRCFLPEVPQASAEPRERAAGRLWEVLVQGPDLSFAVPDWQHLRMNVPGSWLTASQWKFVWLRQLGSIPAPCKRLQLLLARCWCTRSCCPSWQVELQKCVPPRARCVSHLMASWSLAYQKRIAKWSHTCVSLQKA